MQVRHYSLKIVPNQEFVDCLQYLLLVVFICMYFVKDLLHADYSRAPFVTVMAAAVIGKVLCAAVPPRVGRLVAKGGRLVAQELPDVYPPLAHQHLEPHTSNKSCSRHAELILTATVFEITGPSSAMTECIGAHLINVSCWHLLSDGFAKEALHVDAYVAPVLIRLDGQTHKRHKTAQAHTISSFEASMC